MKWRTSPLVLLVILGGVGCSSSSRQESAAASVRDSKQSCVRSTTHGAGALSLRLIAVGGHSGRHWALPGILRIRDGGSSCNGSGAVNASSSLCGRGSMRFLDGSRGSRADTLSAGLPSRSQCSRLSVDTRP